MTAGDATQRGGSSAAAGMAANPPGAHQVGLRESPAGHGRTSGHVIRGRAYAPDGTPNPFHGQPMFRLTAAIPSAVLAASIAALSTASLSKHTLDRLTARFERAGGSADGSGLGLAIVAAITDRIESPLVLRSPRPGASSGFEAFVRLPVGDALASSQPGTSTR